MTKHLYSTLFWPPTLGRCQKQSTLYGTLLDIMLYLIASVKDTEQCVNSDAYIVQLIKIARVKYSPTFCLRKINNWLKIMMQHRAGTEQWKESSFFSTINWNKLKTCFLKFLSVGLCPPDAPFLPLPHLPSVYYSVQWPSGSDSVHPITYICAV